MKDRASDPLKVDPLKAISLSSPTRIRHQTASFKLLTKPQCSSTKKHTNVKHSTRIYVEGGSVHPKPRCVRRDGCLLN
ncbi:hypothetical protein QC762_110650 [Podospora pseudocomata]|uniref:Uncharacterized protein n=1 Tax=Podospora pseudocomata TaxID=2093779 RepID=A0ABR0GV72_9PEZI|nr:hypothetical protein QC762_110650 [Podospora pseudocomata]